MLCSVMSIFDPCPINSLISWKWLVSFILSFTVWISIVHQIFLVKWGGLYFVVLSTLSKIFNNKYFKESLLLVISLFGNILTISLSGLAPWSFALSSHLVITLSLSLPLWVSGLMKTLNEGKEKIVAHLLPFGSPVMLHPFLIIVESVSLIIRPFTLGIRLMANVISGHLILSLIGSGVSHPLSLMPSVLVESIFIGFELGISVVQTYVFVTLINLYWDE